MIADSLPTSSNIKPYRLKVPQSSSSIYLDSPKLWTPNDDRIDVTSSKNFNGLSNEIDGSSRSSKLVHAITKKKLSKLDYYFTSLKLKSEACRQKILCEVASEPEKYAPLSEMFSTEARYDLPKGSF